MSVRFSWSSRLAFLVVLLLTGCGEVAPLGSRPKSDQFLTQARMATLARTGASKEAVRKQFGEPFVVSRDGTAMAFLRCVTVDRRVLIMAVVVPFWTTTSITYFQIQGIWFDAEGKVSHTWLWNGHDGPHGGNPYEPYRVPNPQQALLWLDENAPGTTR